MGIFRRDGVVTLLFVLGMHLFIGGFLLFPARVKLPFGAKRKILVNTHYLPREKPHSQINPHPKKKTQASPSKKPKKSVKRADVVQEKPKPKPVEVSQTKTKNLKRKRKVLAKLKENMAKWQSQKDKSAAAFVPNDVRALEPTVIEETTQQSQFHACLASFLKESLRLPEMGSVKLKLTLDREGNVISAEAESDKSCYNQKFVQSAIEKMKFPPFQSEFPGKSSHTFSIILENAES